MLWDPLRRGGGQDTEETDLGEGGLSQAQSPVSGRGFPEHKTA